MMGTGLSRSARPRRRAPGYPWYLLVTTICLLSCATSVSADIVNPATLDLQEVAPDSFTVTLTLPLIEGRAMKARPVLPDLCVIRGDPVVHATTSRLTRTWRMTCAPEDLVGLPIGVGGLLGTESEVRLTIATLDGKRYAHPLRPTKAFFVMPPPPTHAQLLWSTGRRGLEATARAPELALLLLTIVLLTARRRSVLVALVAFAIAHAGALALADQGWLTVSSFIPRLLAALTAFCAALGLTGSYRTERGQEAHHLGWHHPAWIAMLILGLLYGASRSGVVSTEGLATIEQRFLFAYFAIGMLAGLLLWTLCALTLSHALAGLSSLARERWTRRVGYVAGVGASALCLYQASSLAFVGIVSPNVPPITLVNILALGLWCRLQPDRWGPWFSLTAAVPFATGVALGLRDIALPLEPAMVLGSTALLGAALVMVKRGTVWIALPLVLLTMLYHGHHAAGVLRDGSSSSLMADAVGLCVLLAFLFFASYRVASGVTADRRRFVPRAVGMVALIASIAWRLLDHRDWIAGQIAAEYSMGLLRLPWLALVLLAIALLAWPRRRRFAQRPARGGATLSWAAIALAFFALPHGTVRFQSPWHTPRAPTVTEARRIMNSLLTDTYLAFNLPDERDAFDRLAENLSQDLVADVYLDSRRRLTAGTRQGAEVTVKDVSVMSVEERVPGRDGEGAFTFPCRWIVTARVKHWQHIHNRQNAYVGDLTIRIEEDGWRIARLELRSEERTVLSWKKS